MTVTAYSPLGNPGFVGEGHVKVIDNDVIKGIADAHNVSPAQVCVAWSIQRGVVAIPKTLTLTRVQENYNAYDL